MLLPTIKCRLGRWSNAGERGRATPTPAGWMDRNPSRNKLSVERDRVRGLLTGVTRGYPAGFAFS
jgi:hypothetical protein